MGGALVGLVVLVALAGPALGRRSPFEQNILARTRPPSGAHPLGTDRLGRDILARVVHGARITLLTGGVVALVALAGGLVLGTVSGDYGGRVDAALMRLIDVFMSFCLNSRSTFLSAWTPPKLLQIAFISTAYSIITDLLPIN